MVKRLDVHGSVGVFRQVNGSSGGAQHYWYIIIVLGGCFYVQAYDSGIMDAVLR